MGDIVGLSGVFACSAILILILFEKNCVALLLIVIQYGVSENFKVSHIRLAPVIVAAVVQGGGERSVYGGFAYRMGLEDGRLLRVLGLLVAFVHDNLTR